MKVNVIKTIIIIILNVLLLYPTSSLASSCSRSDATNIRSCSDKIICQKAVFEPANSSPIWSRIFIRHVNEAKRRGMGLNCKMPPIRQSFVNLNKEQRITIQSKLAELSLYKSSIDGLYGPGTAAALKSYNKDYARVGNLSKSKNAEQLIAQILKNAEASDVANTETVDKINTTTPKVTEVEDPKPKTIDDLTSYLTEKNYKLALELAQELVVKGNADAQNILGKMYAEGLGTLQINKTAHMWFNIAALNGSNEASSLRNTLAETMTANAVEEAQDLALKCIQSMYTECGLSTTLDQTPQKPEPVTAAIKDGAILSDDFKAQPVLQRKQLQYALKKLSFYKSSIDGLWGKGTLAAFDAYLKQTTKDFDNPAELFKHLIHESNAPNSFPENKVVPRKPTPAPKETTPDYRNTGRGGWQPLSGNPKISYDDAKSICEPRAIAEGRYFLRTGRTRGGSTYSCTKYGFNSVSCRESSGGGYASGILKGLEEAMTQRDAQKVYEATAKACMAEYGWIKR